MPEPEDAEETWSLWLAPPWKRAHFLVGGEVVDVVFHGTEWWSNGHFGSRTNIGADNVGHGLGWGEDLVRTADYGDLLEIEEVTEGSWIERPVLDAQVALRHDDEHRRGKGLHGLIIGDADRVHLAVDLECGVILRAEAWFRGSLYRVLEMLQVRFDDDLGPDTFDIQPRPGQGWKPFERQFQQ